LCMLRGSACGRPASRGSTCKRAMRAKFHREFFCGGKEAPGLTGSAQDRPRLGGNRQACCASFSGLCGQSACRFRCPWCVPSLMYVSSIATLPGWPRPCVFRLIGRWVQKQAHLFRWYSQERVCCCCCSCCGQESGVRACASLSMHARALAVRWLFSGWDSYLFALMCAA
jgi:hypothetical protein